MSAIPHGRLRVPRARPRHTGAIVAAAAYGAAALTVVGLLVSAWQDPATSAEPAPVAPVLTEPEALTLSALARRAQETVYVVEGAGGAHGSGFVGWTNGAGDRSFVVTARTVIAGVLADGGRTVQVRRANRFWPGTIVRADPHTGLALILVETTFDRVLWQSGSDPSLTAGDTAIVVPAGPGAAFSDGIVRSSGERLALTTGSEPLYLGAPVVDEDGRLAGVVVGRSAAGESRIVSIAEACGRLRECG